MSFRSFFRRAPTFLAGGAQTAVAGGDFRSHRFFTAFARPSKPALDLISDRAEALKEWMELHPAIPLDVSKLAGFPLFKLKKEFLVLFSLDGSGTLADQFSLAVFYGFTEMLRRFRLTASDSIIRFPLGKKKREHIEEILEAIKDQFKEKYGRDYTSQDVDKMYQEFMEIMIETLKHFAEVNPGMREVLCEFTENGTEIAINTGFNRQEADILIAAARQTINGKSIPLGFSITSSEALGRPDPDMLWKTLLDYIYRNKVLIHPWNMAAVDDTHPGKDAALNGGVWSILQLGFSSDLGINTREQAAKLILVSQRREQLYRETLTAISEGRKRGPDFLVMFPSDLPIAKAMAEKRLENNERPGSRPVTVVKEGKVYSPFDLDYNLSAIRLR